MPSQCWDLIREFLQGFMGTSISNTIPMYFTQPIPTIQNTQQTRQNEIYQPLDTIQQYLEHFTTYRKQTNVMVSARN